VSAQGSPLYSAQYDPLESAQNSPLTLAGRRARAFEIKLGASTAVVDAAADALLRVADKVAAPPVALAVVTATGYGLVRPDGVLQIPIGALRA
jgi:hypothetical protein